MISGITTAVSIVYLKEQYDITVSLSDLSNLCIALLPNLDNAQRRSTDLDEIHKHFPTKIRYVFHLTVHTHLVTFKMSVYLISIWKNSLNFHQFLL